MATVDYLVDSDVLIDHLRGIDAARDLLDALARDGARLGFSVISEAEIYSSVRQGEEARIRALFDAMTRLVVDGPTARQAGRYRDAFRGSHRLALPDALIAATAHQGRAILLTRNRRHFPMADIDIIEPYSLV